MRRYHDTVDIKRAPVVTDPYGGEVLDWGHATVVATVRASVQPVFSSDQSDQPLVRSKRKMFCDPTDLLPSDRIVYQGEDYLVDGEIGRWRHRGRDHHFEVFVKRVADG